MNGKIRTRSLGVGVVGGNDKKDSSDRLCPDRPLIPTDVRTPPGLCNVRIAKDDFLCVCADQSDFPAGLL